MKKHFNNEILILLLLAFIIIFKHNSIIKASIISSSILWFKTIVPSNIIMYLIIDLALNYGLSNYISSRYLLLFLSLSLGTPANAKYIREFYQEEHMSLDEANWILSCSYSPNPLFILNVSNKPLIIFIVLYVSNIICACIFRKIIRTKTVNNKHFESRTFSKCLEESIRKSFNVLILILGIIIFYGVLNVIIDMFIPNSFFIKSLLEMTNAVCVRKDKWILFPIAFGGLSIHTQIKSILEDTPISYKYFLYGRLITTLIALLVISVL